jgi:hypothetical protein
MDFESTAIELILPVMESATVLGAHYAKSCGRNEITAQDMRMGMMYAARNVLGKQIGSLYPEIYDEEEEEEEEDEDEDEEDQEWSRYEGEDDMAVKMNECADSWNEWEPESPAEFMLKKAIDKQLEDDPDPNIRD